MPLQRTYVARADHHQIYLGPPTEVEGKIFDGDIGPLVVQPDPQEPFALIIRTGCAYGPVRITFEVVDPGDEPEPLTQPVPGYEISEEVTLPVIGPGLALIDDIGWGQRHEVFAPMELVGSYRVRVSARGRGLSYDGSVTMPEEDYLFQFCKLYMDEGQPRVTVGEDEASRLQ